MGIDYSEASALLREMRELLQEKDWAEKRPIPPEERIDSIGTCRICGYHGPGPKHDCMGPQDRKRERIEVLMEDE